MSNYVLELNDAPATTGLWRGVFFDGPQPAITVMLPDED